MVSALVSGLSGPWSRVPGEAYSGTLSRRNFWRLCAI